MPRERLEAVVRNTELNDAYKVLKHEVKRAEYLLKLEGIDIGEEKPQSTTGATKQLVVDPKLLDRGHGAARGAGRGARRERRGAGGGADRGRQGAARRRRMKIVDEGFAAYDQGDTLDAGR